MAYTFFPPDDLKPYLAKNSYESTQQNAIIVPSKPKEKPTDTRLYHGVLITREGLTGYLETVFTQYGIADQIPIAEAVIFCESGWHWNAYNSKSKGIAQFTPNTWKDYCVGDYDAMNPQQQIRCMARMWKLGLQSRWDCYTGKR